jgi:HAMP domain-containing protein
MAKAVRRRKTRFGVRARMMLLFLLLPLLLMGAASFLYIWQMGKLSELLTDESSNVVNQMAEEKIADLSSAVAMQCKLYLMSHPDLSKQDFSTDMGFKSLAVQKVGLTGYTALYELPGADGVWRTWAHVNPQIIGIDMEQLRESMGSNFAGFWRIYTEVKDGQKSKGYYTWKDKDGQFRKKFMVCTPVPGTPYVVAATTYLDEFHGPLKAIEHKSKAFTEQARMVSLGILGGTMLIIFIFVSIFGHRLTSRIKNLTEVADRISVGDLDIDIDTSSRDEIGELAEAISRMQESIRLSIERLRRRR